MTLLPQHSILPEGVRNPALRHPRDENRAMWKKLYRLKRGVKTPDARDVFRRSCRVLAEAIFVQRG